MQLSRAVAPARYGFGTRRPLDLGSSDDQAHIVLELLRAKQVPTADAVDALALGSYGDRNPTTQRVSDDEIAHAKLITQAEADSLGLALSSAVALYRIDHHRGPTWQQAWAFDAVRDWWSAHLANTPPFKPIGRTAFATLHQKGWLASNQTVRSLCPGRRFYVRFFGDHVSRMAPDVVGLGVAQFISDYLRSSDRRNPTWADIAASAVDLKGVPLFFNTADARAQQLWLVTQGWVRLEDDGSLRHGDRAKAEARRPCGLKVKRCGARAVATEAR